MSQLIDVWVCVCCHILLTERKSDLQVAPLFVD